MNPPPIAPDEPLRRLRTLALVLLGIGVAARVVRYATGAALWGDEAMLGLNVVSRDYAGLTEPLDRSQIAPVGFLWAVRAAVEAFGRSEWAVRLPAFLAAVGALLAFWAAARRAVPPVAGVLAVGMLAVARWPVSMASTLKPYSGDLFWAAVLVSLAVRWRHDPRRVWPLAALAAAVPVALLMSYPVVFVAGAVAVYLLPAVWRADDARPRAWYAAYSTLMLLAFAGVHRHAASHAADPRAVELNRYMKEYWAGGFPPGDLVKAAVWFLEAHTGRMMALPIGDQNGGSSLTFLLFVGGAWVCWKTGRRGLLVLCLGPMALNLVAAAVGAYPYGACARLSQPLVPGVCLLVGVGAAGVVERAGALAARRLAAAVLVLAGFGLGQIAFDLIRPEHGTGTEAWTRGVLAEVGRGAEPADTIVVSNAATGDASFEWYAAKSGAVPLDEFRHDASPPSGRVWFVALGRNEIPPAEEARLAAALGPEWVTLTREEHRRPPDRDGVSLTIAVRCFVRVGSLSERP